MRIVSAGERRGARADERWKSRSRAASEGPVAALREISEFVPEWRAERVECGHFALFERLPECIAESEAGSQTGRVEAGARPLDTIAEGKRRFADRGGCGAQVHEPPSVDLGIGVWAASIRGLEKPG